MDRIWIVFLVLFPLTLAFGIWVTFFSPCSELGWVPVKDLPARCLTGVLR